MPRDAAPTSCPRRSRGGQRARDLLNAIRLDQVAHLQVVEVLDADAALEPLAHFAHVVLEALERGQGAVVHLDTVAHHPHPPGAWNHARAYEAAGDRPHLRDLEDLTDYLFATAIFYPFGSVKPGHRDITH